VTRIPDDLLDQLRQSPEISVAAVESVEGQAASERFELFERVGAGGMGEVFRALDRQSGQIVAVKLLGTLDDDDESYTRFRREASALADLSHPAIVGYVAHGRLGSRAFLAMEWLEGETLAQRFDRQGLTVAETVELGLRIASALASAHERGIVHRDVKPSNVFLPDGEVARARLIDFGLARHTWVPSSLTAAGTALGTPGYMAPEQARGSGWLDARVDVFALGCVLYRCLTGRRAFRGDDALALMAKTLFSYPPRPRELVVEVPPALDSLVMRMLAKEPRQRPSDAEEVLALLGSLAPADGVHPAPNSDAYPTLTRAERRLGSVLLISPDPRSTLLAGDAPPSTQPAWSSWTAAARAHGVELSSLADASIVASLDAEATALESVAHMARAALALRVLIPRVPMVLTTGRGVVPAGATAGEVVDRAAAALARLRANKDPHVAAAVWIDRVSASLLAAHFDVVPTGSELWLAGERGLEEVRPLQGRIVPHVGRERVLSALESLWRDVSTNRASRAAIVTGPPGIGKTRLWQELVRRLRARGDAPSIWIGRADPTRAGAPYALLAHALRRVFGLYGGEPADRAYRKIEARVSVHVPAPRRARVTAVLAELVGVPGGVGLTEVGESELRAERLLDALLEFVRAEAESGPVCLVLEDLQWGDRPSVGFATHAARLLSDRGLLLIGIARPELATTFPDLWSELSPVSVPLAPLSRRSAAALVRSALDSSISNADVAALVTAADGNPYALEELVRAHGEGRSGPPPESVLALVDERLEQLSPETRRVLRAASIFGSAFWPGALDELVHEADVDGAIDELVKREVVSCAPMSRFANEPELVFRQSFVREAAYASLTPEDRVLGHRLAANWLERMGVADAESLAEHHRVGDRPGRAVPHYQRAAREALWGSDFAAAIARVDRALECVAVDAARGGGGFPDGLIGALYLTLAEARRWSGDARAALAAANVATQKLDRGSESWLSAMGELSRAAGRVGDYDRLQSTLEDAVAIHVDAAHRGAQLAALCPGTAQLLQAGRVEHAMRLFGALESIARRTPIDVASRARLEQLRGFVLMHRGEPWLAMGCYALARDSFRELGSPRNVAIEQINFATAAIDLGAFEQARAELDQALFAADLLGLATVRAFAQLNLGRVLASEGRLDEAERAQAAALEIGMSDKSPRTTGAARVHLARIALARGDGALAEAEARAAADLLQVAPPLRVGALATLAESLLLQGAVADAAAPAREALALAKAGHNELFDALARLTWVAVARASGDEAGGVAELAEAVDAISSRAARIADVELRRSFLERVEEHAATLALARELGVTGDS
jgi:eukaryotic-like serine/threonine-protein kinase